jgi:hypothetical protein
MDDSRGDEASWRVEGLDIKQDALRSVSGGPACVQWN